MEADSKVVLIVNVGVRREGNKKIKFPLQIFVLCYNKAVMRRSIFRISEMNSIEKTIFVVCFAGMFFVFLFDFTGFLQKNISRIFFSVFLGVFILNWMVVLIHHRKK